MLLAFIVFTVCPSSEEKIEEMDRGIMRNMCRNKSEVLMIAGSIIAALVVFRLMMSKSKKNLKQKFKQG